MKVIYICIGSACHLKGTHEVIEIFRNMIEIHHLENQLELKAAFCIGHCTEAVSVQKWDGTVLSVQKENAKAIFESEILPYL
ncbi:MAG: (2Fe-2S) ferredoxin domain-containing protein [Cellulosilyticum sp.]|nr:(2Fe-2S) ferredoxin domain-containing protein [Cellulosilyticum sp.]